MFSEYVQGFVVVLTSFMCWCVC